MVARNAWGSKPSRFLAATLGLMTLLFVWSAAETGARGVIFLLREEPSGWRAGDICLPGLRLKRGRFYFIPLADSINNQKHLAVSYAGWIQGNSKLCLKLTT